jgi:ubiquinone/menaquinone biosynthesis C-methylase UbiE
VFTPLELVEANFRKPTGWFGQVLGHLMAVQHKSLTRWAIELMNVHAGDWVLDVGCGGGMAVKLLADRAKYGFVAGVDYSPAMVQQATRRNHDRVQRGKVAIEFGNAMALPYRDCSFDKACGIETLYFWPDPVAGLRELRRVLKAGGEVAIAVEMSKESTAQKSALQKYFSQRYSNRSAGLGMSILSGPELVEMLTEAGFHQPRYVAEPNRALGWLCGLGRA